jgi:ribosome biogenesis GTPase
VEPLSSALVGTAFRVLGKEVSVRVETDEGLRILECHLRGRLFGEESSELKNQIAVGDEVELDSIEPMAGPGPFKGVIHTVRPRRTALVRRVGGKKPRLQVLAANVDQLVVVSALVEPSYKRGLIDRYLVIAHQAGIAPALCLNKVDRADERTLSEARTDLSVYQSLGYPLVLTSAKTNAGLDELRRLLTGKRTVLVGHSGVGKSKLAGALKPGIQLASATVDRKGRGRHTTTAATLFPLDFSGELVDTPGVRELSIRHIERTDLAGLFLEFLPRIGRCRFTPCSHLPEPECAVKEALAEGHVTKERYESYRKLYEELS